MRASPSPPTNSTSTVPIFSVRFLVRCTIISILLDSLSFFVRSFCPPSLSRRRYLPTSILMTHPCALATGEQTKEQLEKMTVKQLRAFMEESGMEVRGGLRLKRDIVEFIEGYHDRVNTGDVLIQKGVNIDHYEESNSNDDNNRQHEESNTTDHDKTHSRERISNIHSQKRTRMGTGMPPLPSTIDVEHDGIEPYTSEPPPYVLTPKDRIVLDALDRYPPLHDAIVAGCVIDTNDDSTQISFESITSTNIDQCNLNALSYAIPSGIGEDDMRQKYHPMLANCTQSDLDIVFIGTASCTPGLTRGVSCTAVRLNWRSQKTQGEGSKGYVEERGPTLGTWLFDCGEATQLSIQKTTSIKPGKISKIFITHCHGDHSFGLPGLLCLMGTDRDRDAPPIDIYGPEGLRMWLRIAIRYSVSRIVPSYRVHELMDVPMAPEWEQGHRRNGRFYFQLNKEGSGHRWGTKGLAGEDPVSWISRAPMINLEPSADFGEVDGGTDIYPRYDHPQCHDGAPTWEVENDGDVTVYAAPMSHGVPCVGYVIEEHDRPGRLLPENVQPIIERNFDALVSIGMRNPMKVMAMVKNLPVGGSYTFPDGTVVRQEDVVEPPRKGRKLVICGDTADCRALEGLAQGADVLIHEATNTFLPGVDKDTSMRIVTREAKLHGHSTPFMAGEFAERIKAKKLVLNHFSARYKGDQSIESITIMTRMERQAMKASGLPEDSVACAWDFMLLRVPRN